MASREPDKQDVREQTCPQCKRRFSFGAAEPPKWLPFCSDRCQWVDLGRWMGGEFRVSRPVSEQDLERQD